MMIAWLLFIHQTLMLDALHKSGFPVLAVHDKSIIAVKDETSELVAQSSSPIVSPQFHELQESIFFLNENELKKKALTSVISQPLLSFPQDMEVTQLVLDKHTDFLFFIDSLNQTIYISKLGEFIKPIVYFEKELQAILEIQLDAKQMWLFVLVRVGSITELYQLQYDGTRQQPIHLFSSTNCRFAVDTDRSRLYLLDEYSTQVHVLQYNSTRSALQYNDTRSASIPPISLSREVGVTSMLVLNNTLYITGRKINGVLVVDLTDNTESLILSHLGQLSDLVSMSPALLSSSPCSNVCHQLCTGTTANTNPGSEVQCFCGDGYTLTNVTQSHCQMNLSPVPLFLCKTSGLLVPTAVQCDGVNDCWDFSDEKNCDCEGYVCPSDGRCISSSLVCDSVPNCPRAEDEQCCDARATCCHDNSTCQCDARSERSCKAGGCVRVESWCDGVQDCTDRSDELNCTEHRQHAFLCKDRTQYIPLSWRCDGRYDCSDFSDEASCLGEPCSSTQVSCDNGMCLEVVYVCDGTVHCNDKSDEMNCLNTTCQNGTIACGDGTCLSSDLFCNGIPDCSTNSTIFTDEIFCDSSKLVCPQSQFMCNSSTCIPRDWRCDGTTECADGRDELDCPDTTDTYTCANCTCDTDIECSQRCVAGKCTCGADFSVAPSDNRTCVAHTPAIVYFTTNNMLYSTQLRSGVFSAATQLSFDHSPAITAFDADAHDIVAASGGQIFTINLPESGKHTVKLIIKRQREIRWIAVDWSTGNIYWVEEDSLMLSNTRYTGLKTLSREVFRVVLETCYSNLYYTTTRGNLVTCKLDMTECTTLVQSGDAAQVYLDQASRTLYYTTLNSSLYTVNTAGTSHLLAHSLSTDNNSIQQIAYFENRLFYVTPTGLMSYDKLTGSKATVSIHLSNGTPVSPATLALAHASLQPSADSPCKEASCSQLCTLSVSGRASCFCSDDFSLSDGVCVYAGEQCEGILRCDDRSCLREESERCDGFRDCYDGSDELHCSATCSSSEWKCAVGGCIHASLRCDASLDCVDGSDEQNCSGQCEAGFLCSSGVCINSALKCNRHPDCPDMSDERVELCGQEPCSADTFQCKPNHCIPLSWKCDGYSDCENGTDEADCPSEQCVIRCDERESGEARCLPATARCNDISDCVDGTDEAECDNRTVGCKDWEFACKDGSACISFLLRCDGVAQCSDKSDETRCDKCKEGYTRCDSGKCLHPRYNCDGNRDCPLGEDELDCDHCEDTQIFCDGFCLPAFLRCDGEWDCIDGKDEMDCISPHCRPDQFMCRSGSCVDKHYRCDGGPDCADNSDEENCSVCPLTHFLCDTGLCLGQEAVCDGSDDCQDGSDERGCEDPVNECLSRPCDLEHGSCVDLKLGYYCSCDPGYELARNKKFCMDSDECDLRAHKRKCAQKCYNTVGSFSCGCEEGFSLDRRDGVSCDPDTPLSYLLLSAHSLYLLSEPSYFNLTRELVLFDLPDTVHHAATHFTPTTTFLYTAQGSTIQRYVVRDSPSLDKTWRAVEGVTVSSLAVDWSTGSLYWSDPVLGRISLITNSEDGRGDSPVSLVRTHCDKVRNLVLLPERGEMFFVHVHQGVARIAQTGLDGSRRRSVTGQGEMISHFDVDHITSTLYYVSTHCQEQDSTFQTFCLYKLELKYPASSPQLLEKGQTDPTTGFRVFSSHIYFVKERRGVLKCTLDLSRPCTPLTTGNQTLYTDILIYSPLSQPAVQDACGGHACGEGAVCVNTAVDAQGAQLQASCVCESSSAVYQNGKCREVELECSQELYFSCAEGGCVEARFRCDGVEDCRDGSDELKCDEVHCNDLVQFPCSQGDRCVPIERRCDGYPDCPDNSDEESCSFAELCLDSELLCTATKTCVPKVLRCDGTADCLDGEDEEGCGEVECAGLQCLNNNNRLQCYPDSVVGDGLTHCYYAVDEDGSKTRCQGDDYQCGTLCYPDAWHCDGEHDCTGEESCDPTCDSDHVKIRTSHQMRCISRSLQCDGWKDLPGGEDEKDCAASSCQGLPCNGMCVPSNVEWVCEGYCGVDVVRVYSQLFDRGCQCRSTERQCADGRCVAKSSWCDKEEDCSNREDEMWCPSSDCQPPDFCCSYSGRILRDGVGLCDGADDCLDGSDELVCPVPLYPQCAPDAYDCKSDQPLEERCVSEPSCDNSIAHPQRSKCANQRDVLRCNHGDPCGASNGGCAHVCTPLSDNTRQCSCFLGYYLASDGRTCTDINECEDPNTCGQVCTNLRGSYTCSCVVGFVKSGTDGSSCKLQTGPVQVLLSTEFDLRLSTPTSLTRVTSDKRASYKFSFHSAHSNQFYYVVDLVDKFRLFRLASSGDVLVAELEGTVQDLQYNPLTNNVVYCNSHSVILISLTNTLTSTLFPDINRPVQKLALSPQSGLVFFIRHWMLGVMNSDGSNHRYLASDNNDLRTYQFKDGRATSLSVDEPAKRVYWYDPDLQQLSSVTYGGERIRTVRNKLKNVLQIQVMGEEVYYHTGRELWSVAKRGSGEPVRRESLLPRCSHISLVTTWPVLLDKCRECGSFLCLIVPGHGPSCSRHHDNNTCPCMNGGNCALNEAGFVECQCLEGFSGETCQSQPHSSQLLLVICIVLGCTLLAILVLCYSFRRKCRLILKDLISGGMLHVPSVRYSRHSSSGAGDNNVGYGIFNDACEEYDLEEITTDQSHLMEQNLEEDVI